MKKLTLTLCFLCIFTTFLFAEEKTREEYLAEARVRIETVRKTDAEILLVDEKGKPLANTEVKIHQTCNAFRFGCNLFMLGRCRTPELNAMYENQFAEVFNFATLGVYVWAYHLTPETTIAERIHTSARWCREHGIEVKAHPLWWNFRDCRWFDREFGEKKTPEALEKLNAFHEKRVTNLVTEFQGKIETWDVVNEAVAWDREKLRNQAPWLTALWLEKGKVPFTLRAFEIARHANPDAELLINDYRMDSPYENFLSQLVNADGEPVYDAIGLQAHQLAGVMTPERFLKICETYARFGKPLHFTETTILSCAGANNQDPEHPLTTPEGEALQAEGVEFFYTMAYAQPAVEAVTWWDFSDFSAWQKSGGLLRADMTPKPAYLVLRRLIKQDWATNGTFVTDAEGKITARFTYGDYELTFAGKEAEPVKFQIHKEKNVAEKSGPTHLRLCVPSRNE